MSTPETISGGGRQTGDGLSAAESKLGGALALIHKILPHLDEPDHAVRVQNDLRRAIAFIESAREAHALDSGVRVGDQAYASVEAETVAAIAAAIAVLLGRPFKLVSVQPLFVPPPHLNVWAFEGRTQIFMSHKVR
jgi:2-phospho-L-lactate transferase/gluconeogenesis factor (CofD/UPF0052 family)